MLKLKSNTIQDFPFQEYAKCQNPSQLEDLAKAHYLTSFNSWMLPQIAHHYGTWTLVFTAEGKVDPKLTARENIKSQWDIGLWKVCTQLKRGSLVKSQINPEFASYSALVPLILMGSKKYKGIGYNKWDIDSDTFLVDKNLREAMFWQPDDSHADFPDMIFGELQYAIKPDRLLELREQGLTVKSGPAKGKVQAPTSSWCLKGMRGTELGKAPKLTGTMLTQIWVAHPSLRTEYMVLDPNDWDWMPPPLVSANIFKAPEQTTKQTQQEEILPWL